MERLERVQGGGGSGHFVFQGAGTAIRWAVMAAVVAVGLAGCQTGSERDRQSLDRGFDAYSAGQYDAAAGAAGGYIAKYPDDAAVDEAYYLRGLSRMGLGDRAGAAADLRVAIAKSNRDDLRGKAWRGLGELAFEGERFEEAMQDYREALGYYPAQRPDALVVYRIGACLQALGQWDAARPWFQRVLEVSPAGDALALRALERRDARGFSLQFGAYGSLANANDALKQLKAQGIISGVVVPEMQEGTMLYMVRAGMYRTYDEAEAGRAGLIGRFPEVRVVP